jgi:hypothetical protein
LAYIGRNKKRLTIEDTESDGLGLKDRKNQNKGERERE